MELLALKRGEMTLRDAVLAYRGEELCDPKGRISATDAADQAAERVFAEVLKLRRSKKAPTA